MNEIHEQVWGWGHLDDDLITQVPLKITTSIVPKGIYISKDSSVM